MRPILVTLWYCLVFAFAGGRADATIGIALQMQLGNPSGATADANNHEHYLIERPVQAIDYNDRLGQPNWVSWDLTASDIGTVSRADTFITDTSLPMGFERVTPDDYTNSGYDRGHMCASKDRTATRADNDLVFLMSNIIPQRPVNNSGVWGTFEGYCRSLAETNEVLILCGPSGFGTNRLPSGKAYISTHTWKVVVVVPQGIDAATNRITAATRVIALKIPNTDDATNKWPYYVTSATEIEVDTGLKFFTALPANLAETLRSKVDGQTNPPPGILSFSPTGGAANTNVLITGIRFETNMSVKFNGMVAAFDFISDTQITATVPANARSGSISVTTSSGTAISVERFSVEDGGIYYGLLAGWDVSGQTNYGSSLLPAGLTATNLMVTGLTRGAGVGSSGTGVARGWGGTGFTNGTLAAAVAANRFLTFSVSAKPGFKVSFDSLSRFDYRRSNTGPVNGVLQYQVGGSAFVNVTNLAYSVSAPGGASIGPINLAGIAALQEVGAGTNVTFRVVNYSGTSSAGNWYVYDVANTTAPDLAIEGSVKPVVTLTPLQSWRQKWFGTTNNSADAADTSVATDDGLPNLFKYALGFNPLVAADRSVTVEISMGFLRLKAPRNPDATDVTYTVFGSDDLVTWTTSGIVVDPTGPNKFQAHDSLPVSAGGHRFLRLEISPRIP